MPPNGHVVTEARIRTLHCHLQTRIIYEGSREPALFWLITRCVITQKSVRFTLEEAHLNRHIHEVFEWGGDITFR
jgi:hypothetical protein